MFGCGESRLDALLQWRSPRETGPVFVVALVFLVAVRYLSLLSVVGNLSLALLTATMAFRIYKSVLAAVNKSGEGNPFKTYLESDHSLTTDRFQDMLNCALKSINDLILTLKSAFLIDDVIQSIKFAFGMYMLTVTGRWMNGLTLMTLAWVLAFSVPKVYKDNQKAIDEAVAPVKAKLDEFLEKLKASMPANVSGKKAE